ncbi:tetratricopeptide repeat protein [Pseudomonas simiae]|uniref:Tetratricopeptide repeat-containing protein n=1 Tax=Pseudomonas simiae TaxID=321846 RepID=U1TSG9_9PSED|nr:hypothetical protein [Pseudomonas simiae]ERH61129.1 hypothetical protein O204_15585 [Pseudomonas simiae]NVH61284.1 hypothetical protein [Pseudomonas simiae]QQD29159.2 hypothetical protein ICJ33_08095 [Pseudomonas simiae]
MTVSNQGAVGATVRIIILIVLGYAPSISYSAAVKKEELAFTSYKELAQIRLENTRDILQKDIQALSSRLDIQDKRLDTQNSHIDQSLSLLGILLTALGIILPLAGLAGYFSVSRKARSEAQTEAQKEARKEAKVTANEWFGVHADELQTRLDALQEKLQALENQAEVGFNLHIQRVQDGADLAIKEIQLSVSGQDISKAKISETAASALAEAATAATNKPESTYTFRDWNNRAFDAYRKGETERAARFWRDAADVKSATPQQVSQAMSNAGAAMTELKRYEQAIGIYDEFIKRFDGKEGEDMKSSVAEALNGKAGCLGLLGRFDEADALLDIIISRLEKNEILSHSEYMAHALTNKIIGLSIKNLDNQAFELCEYFLSRFDDADTQEIVKHLITVRSRKIGLLSSADRTNEANQIFDHTIAQFGEWDDSEIKDEIGKLKNAKAFALLCQAKAKWADLHFRKDALKQAANLFDEAIAEVSDISVPLGNQAYCAHLLGENKKSISEKLLQGLTLDGKWLYEATLRDLLIHPVPEKDETYRVLLEELWTSIREQLKS